MDKDTLTEEQWRELSYTYEINRNNKEIERQWRKAAKHRLPRKLYRYRPAESHDIISLKENTIWLSNPSQFNDPYDCKLEFDIEAMYAEQFPNDGSVLTIRTEYKKKFKKIMKNTRRTTFVGSFAIEIDNILMWSHYAKNHQGFCVEYDGEEVDDFARKNHGVQYQCLLAPIYYTNKHVSIKRQEDIETHGHFFDIRKAPAWKYENEWRLVFKTAHHEFPTLASLQEKTAPKKKGVLIPGLKPKAVYLGAKMKPKEKKKIQNECYKNGIDVYEMKMKNDCYELEAIRLK